MYVCQTCELPLSQFKTIFIFFYDKLYHTIIRTVVTYVFHYFTLYGRRLGLRHCCLSIFLPNSEVLADTVQKDVLSLLIEFPIEQVIRVFPVSDITYLRSNRKRQGVRYPGLGSLPPPPHPPGVKIPWPGQLAPHPWKLGKFQSEKLFNHFKLKTLMHRH